MKELSKDKFVELLGRIYEKPELLTCICNRMVSIFEFQEWWIAVFIDAGDFDYFAWCASPNQSVAGYHILNKGMEPECSGEWDYKKLREIFESKRLDREYYELHGEMNDD